MNAGRNTQTHTPHPTPNPHAEHAHESTDAEARFIAYIIDRGIPLADHEDQPQDTP